MKLFSKKLPIALRLKVFSVALVLMLVLGVPISHLAVSAEPTGQPVPYSAIYSADNPIPMIAADVRPAVVQVINVLEAWNVNDGPSFVDQGYGSGVYIDARGYVVTNYHVVEGADKLEVETLSGKRIPCTLQGVDDGTDLAVLKLLEPLDVQPVPYGDSDSLQIGELAIAIGNPGDSQGVLFGTVTAGIISALNRQDVNAQNFSRRVNVIQTDAAINTGNSGGALLNAQGQLIGIPTLKFMFDNETVYEGLGFAVPINTARPVIEQIINKGKVSRPRMGVEVSDFAGPDEPIKGYPPAGVQVLTLEKGGPADRAGLVLYDIITSIQGVRITTYRELTSEIDRHKAGEKISIQVYRCFDPSDASLLKNPRTLDFEVDLELLD